MMNESDDLAAHSRQEIWKCLGEVETRLYNLEKCVSTLQDSLIADLKKKLEDAK